MFLKSLILRRDAVPTFDRYPFSIPAVRGLHELNLEQAVTFFVGDNGTGKSTLIEAIAVAAGFNAEGGSRNFNFASRRTESESHGEAFLALALNRFRGQGLYILDEPEAALSPQRQLALLVLIDQLVRQQASQFVIATHSPILMAYPTATIYHPLPGGSIETIAYEETEHYRITRDFLTDRDAFRRELFDESEG